MKKEWIVLGFLALVIFGGEAAVQPTVIDRVAEAIAFAEGFYKPGSLPERANNPGDISAGGQVIHYPTLAEGWAALRRQVEDMFSGTSAYYDPSMTIAEIATHYAEDSANWARNVAAHLGVTVSTRLADLI
jgi:hypothetical protein